MINERKGPVSIDAYIAGCAPAVRPALEQLRACIHAAAPAASEKISYAMPTFYLFGNLVHFAAHTHHIGFYPAPTGIEAFKAEIAPFVSNKGAMQFPLDAPLPLDLVRRIVLFRVQENTAKAQAKRRRPRGGKGIVS